MKIVGRVAVVLVAMALCGWLLLRWAYTPLRCNIDLTALTQRTGLASETSSDYERLSRLRRNLEDLAALEDRCRMDVRLYMLVGQNEEMLGRDEDAIRSYEQALTVDRRPEIYSAIGFALIRLGRVDEAVPMYVQAARFLYPDPIVIPSELVERRVAEILRGEH
jgi:tetratricopeptide (TPR) repeat protein